MKLLLVLLFALVFPGAATAQSTPPPWPKINFTSCPRMSQPVDPSQRTWKHGQTEYDHLNSAIQMLQAKNYATAADAFAHFAEDYPDSDNRDHALILEMAALQNLNDQRGQVRVAEELVRFPLAEPATREVGFAELSAILAPYVSTDDPAKERKLTDLDSWVRCGREALKANVRMSGTPQAAFDETQRTSQSVFDRTEGYVALARNEYAGAISYLDHALGLNPQDAMTNLWLGSANLLNEPPDLNSGVFYLARHAELTHQAPEGADFLKQIYVTVHGSEKGLSDVKALAKSNTVPPPNFSVLRQPKEKHHYGAAIAAAAVAGLLVYEMVQHPWVAQGIASSLNGGPVKMMLFGGPGHTTYLGCLSCSEDAADSILNEDGLNGKPDSPVSIWNKAGQFGSPRSDFSACNRSAGDPPVIVDQEGKFYGRLTINTSNPQIGVGMRFYGWVSSTLCGPF